MQKITTDDPMSKSTDLVAANVEQLKALFPQAWKEGKLDFDVLKQLLGGVVDEREERFGLNWHGKRQARQLALTPSTGTLRPCPEDSVDWDTTQNLMIEGDNLEVLKILQRSYAGKVKLIYIDPPYNTGNDFVYPDNFTDNIKNYLELTGQVEGGRKISTNTEASGRFHTDWLNMMYPRLMLARELLRDDGLLFVSIDDVEVSNLRLLLDSVFGEERRVGELIWKNKYNAGALTKGFSSVHEYVLCYSGGNITNITAPLGHEEIAAYKGRDSKFDVRGGFVTQPLATNSKDPRPNLRFPISLGGREIWPEKQWIWSRERVEQAIANDELVVNESNGRTSVRVKQYLKDERGEMREMKPLSILVGPYNQEGTAEVLELFDASNVFQFPKPLDLIRHFVSLTVNDAKDTGAIVMDFFCGSGTLGQAVLAQNAIDGARRRFVVVQLPEPLDKADNASAPAREVCEKHGKPHNIAELTKERLRRAGKKIKAENPLFAGDVGFRVFKLASTNIREWDPDRDKLPQTLQDSVEHLKSDRTESDILYELLLKSGLDLCVPIETRVIAGKDVHSIGGGVLFACLATSIKSADVEPLAQGIVDWRTQLAPAGDVQCIFRDSAFADDVAKSNLAAILEQQGIEKVRSL
ncbi:MAG: site-specific DNA-methyltransferase [Planctomycetes bacterium]|nr:site-specific DNA-methyltransferase [Planctomycetota bacterium]